MNSFYSGKKVFITGGTGSLGKTLIETILESTRSNVEIVVYSRDEAKQAALRSIYPDTPIRYLIGDIRDYDHLEKCMIGSDIVIHTAALKRVDDGESNVSEFIKTNVYGTENVVNAALSNKCEKAILTSTDKACMPINAYGATKKIAEKLFLNGDYDITTNKLGNTKFVVIRYGNIIASRGSIIPIFVDGARENIPLKVTHPEMTRFFMTLYDATSLIEYALSQTKGGDIFVSKMNAVIINKMAEKIIETLGSSSDIKFIGTRPGEKIHESLIAYCESPTIYDTGDYFCIPSQLKETKYNYQVASIDQYSSDLCLIDDYNWIIEKIKDGGINL